MTIVAPSIIEQIRSTYRDARVLVTGGASFISSYLVEALVGAGARVRVVDDLSSGKIENLAAVRSEIEFEIGDLRDPSVAERACARQELVFHLAAAHGGRGYIDTHPVECLNNLTLDHAVFAAAARGGTTKIIHASSACAYPVVLQSSAENRRQLVEDDAGFDEPGKAFADGAYGWTKLMGEYQLANFVKQFGISGIACRLFTAYGERENESHAVVALIAKAVAGMDPYPIWGDGSQTRNFTYVADTVTGMLLSGHRLKGFEVINVGSPRHHSINELIETIFQVLSWRPEVIERQLDRPVGVLSRAADCAKSESLLGWSPETALVDGITRTAAWYRSVVERDPARLARLNSALMSR